MNNDWTDKLDNFGEDILTELGYSYPPDDHNPITQALKFPDFVERYGHLRGFNRTSLSKVATICQMAVFDAEGGPEGDGKPKALRRHWYAWFKGEFAQPLSEQLGEDLQSERWGLNWNSRQAQVYAWFVDNADVTYRDLWVEDASRMMTGNQETLFRGCNIIIAVEKDSLFGDFISAGEALGARTVYSGKGKSSKAAIERVMRNYFGWRDDADNEQAIIILHISDFDYAGEAVIGPTFGEQARRYCNHVYEARVGIKPESVVALGHDPRDKWYQIKVGHNSSEEWAVEKALFLDDRGDVQSGIGYYYFDKEIHIAHGYEVEALRTRDYYGMLVDALLTVLPFDFIVGRLRDECTANAEFAASKVRDEILVDNESYQELLDEFNGLEEIKKEFEHRIYQRLYDSGSPRVEDWRDDGDDLRPSDYRQHVESGHGSPWRPFDHRDRTESLIEWLRENESDTIGEFKQERVECRGE